MNTWTVYLLRCSDGKLYTGCTSDLKERVRRHNSGFVQFTKSRLPISVLVAICFYDKYKAYAFEKYLKSGSGREFMRRHFL